MKTRVNILFWTRRKRGEEKDNPAHTVHIMCRVTVRGQQQNAIEFHTGLETQKDNWQASGSHGHAIGKTQADRHVNTQLVKLTDELNDIHADLERQGRAVTASAIIRLYKNHGATLSLLDLFSAFLAERRALVGVEIATGSLSSNLVRYNRLTEFLTAHKLTDLRPEEMTHNMADKLLHWLLAERSYKRSTANKMVQTVFQVLRWGVRREHLDKNPLELYEYKTPPPAEIKYLNLGELQELTALPMPSAALDRVRDCFVFQCWTGLAYADLAGLDIARDAEYHRGEGGNLRRLLRVRRAKSTLFHGFECIIPLLPEAERLLTKYEDELPVPTNQVYNRYLKEVGEVCGLPAEKMTSHVGRKTAGVTMLNLGIRMETVSKFLGHSSVKMTEKIYAKILDTTVIQDFGKLFASAPIMEAAPTVYALPEPKPEPQLLRPARRVGEAPSPGADGRWKRPAPVTSHGPRL